MRYRHREHITHSFCPHTYGVRGFVRGHSFATDTFSPNGLKEVAKCLAISWRVICGPAPHPVVRRVCENVQSGCFFRVE